MDLAAKHNPHQNIIDKVTTFKENIIDKVTTFKDLKNDFF